MGVVVGEPAVGEPATGELPVGLWSGDEAVGDGTDGLDGIDGIDGVGTADVGAAEDDASFIIVNSGLALPESPKRTTI